MIAPCRDCQERTPECHGRCERYRAYKESRERALQNRDRERDAEQVTVSSVYRMKRRNPAKHKS